MPVSALLLALAAAAVHAAWNLLLSGEDDTHSASALELLYLALLATGYSVAAMSFIYPIARGSAPVLVLVAGAVAVGASVSVLGAVGVVVVALGIVLVRGVG